MIRTILAGLFASAIFVGPQSALAAGGGELTCAQMTRLNADAKRPPTDEADVRLRAYCKKNPKAPFTKATEAISRR